MENYSKTLNNNKPSLVNQQELRNWNNDKIKVNKYRDVANEECPSQAKTLEVNIFFNNSYYATKTSLSYRMS